MNSFQTNSCFLCAHYQRGERTSVPAQPAVNLNGTYRCVQGCVPASRADQHLLLRMGGISTLLQKRAYLSKLGLIGTRR